MRRSQLENGKCSSRYVKTRLESRQRIPYTFSDAAQCGCQHRPVPVGERSGLFQHAAESP